MASDGEPAKPKKRNSQATDAGVSKDKKDDGAGVAVGDAVLVQSADDKSAFLPATVTRKHMSGEFTVEYSDSGKTEKYVKPERIQVKKRAASKAKPTNDAEVTDKGDKVLYRLEGEKKWRDGVVKMCRKDGSFDIVDKESEDIVKKVGATDVKKKSGGKEKDEDGRDDKEEDGDAEWEVGDKVEFQEEGGKSKAWQRGRVKKKRKDGTFDISHESDADEVAQAVDAKRIRKPSKAKPKKKQNSIDDEDEDTKDATSIRKRKSNAKRKTSSQADEDEDGSDGGAPKRKRATSRARQSTASARRGVRFGQLRLHQLVEFQDDDGHSHRGYIKLLRQDDRACDIEHESDTEHVSKRVPAAQVTPVSLLSKLWGSSRLTNQSFALNARVFYRTKEGMERKGFVIKIHRDTSPACYDIEDEIEGDVIRKVPGSKLRAVPWLNYSLPSLPAMPGLPGLPSMPSMPSLPSWTMLRKGMQVRVRRREGDDDEDGKRSKNKGPPRVYWQDGVVLRLKNDATCVVECVEADGVTKTKLTVKNGDVRPKFMVGLPGLTLPTLQLPQGLHPPKSSVEVLAEGKAKVFLGTIVTVNEADKTYTILYADGRKEKNVAAHRVRLCLRKLRIGTEVEMIVEGPCKEVSKLDGEVAWVHRNEKVAVRINGGNNDVFAEVCTHALMVDGQPAFAAPLSSTWLELMSVYANLTLEALVFLWFCFGLCVEIGEMARLRDDTSPEMLSDPLHMTQLYATQSDWQTCAASRHLDAVNGTYLAIPKSFLVTDRAWLLAMTIIKVLLAVACVGLSCRLIQNKISALQDNFIDVKEYQLDRVLRRHFSRVMGFTIVLCFLTLLIYASLLNRFEFFCLFQADSLKFDNLALHVEVFAVHTEYATTVELLQSLAAKSLFNLFRGVALHVLVFALPNASFLLRLCLWLPVSIAVTSLVGAMGVASLHIFYYVQRVEMLEHAAATLTTQVDWAVVATLVALWFNATIVRLVAATGSYFETVHTRQTSARGDLTDDIIDQAERGEFGLQAKQEALYSRVELKQEQLGVCKLSVLRVQRHLGFHLVSMVVGIIATCTLRAGVADDAAVVHAALTLHLVVCIIWLIIVLLTAFLAIVVKREAPELLAYILDV